MRCNRYRDGEAGYLNRFINIIVIKKDTYTRGALKRAIDGQRQGRRALQITARSYR